MSKSTISTFQLFALIHEVHNGYQWMEVCSTSRRKDFPQKLVVSGKKGNTEKDALVLEIAIGLDRLLYCSQKNSIFT